MDSDKNDSETSQGLRDLAPDSVDSPEIRPGGSYDWDSLVMGLDLYPPKNNLVL